MTYWQIRSKVLYFLIFLSGVSALFYELIWVRLLTLFFGVSSFAIATIVGTFLGGIALGSYIFGKLSEKETNLIRMYAFLELFIALSSVVVFLLLRNLELLHELYSHYYNTLSFYSLSVIRLLFSIALLIVPSTLIGGTIPLVSKYLIRGNEHLGREFSKIYYINTLGALTGVFLVSFLFIRLFGVAASFYVAFSINVLIFLFLFIFSRRIKHIFSDRRLDGQEKTRNSALLFVFLAGFIHIGYEVLWVRVFSAVTSGTTYIFSLVLSGFLLGFMLGGYFISKKIDRIARKLHYFGYLELLVAFSSAVLFFSLPLLNSIREASSGNNFLFLVVEFFSPFLFSLVPAIFMGMTFPVLLKYYSPRSESIGSKTGAIYAFSTVGSIAGSIVVGFLFIPFFGMKVSGVILVLLGLLLSFVMIRKKGMVAKALLLLSLVLIFFSAGALDFNDNKIYYDEGFSATVSVTEIEYPLGKFKSLNVDGQGVASTHPRLVIDSKILAHIPLLLVDNPKKAATVGYGTGGTSYSMVLHGVEVHALEIEGKVIDATGHFRELNHYVEENESLNLIIDDARGYLSATDETFDVIVTDVTNLKYRSNPSLYSKDYFEILKEKSTEKGVVAAWVPLSFVAIEELQILTNSFQEVFPHTTIWHYTEDPTHFLVFVGTREKLKIDLNEVAERMERVEGDLVEIGIENEYDFGSMLFMGENDVYDFTAGAEIHSDDRPVLEFAYIADYYRSNQYPNLRSLVDYKNENLLEYFDGSNDQKDKLYSYFIASFHSIESQFALFIGNVDEARRLDFEAEKRRV